LSSIQIFEKNKTKKTWFRFFSSTSSLKVQVLKVEFSFENFFSELKKSAAVFK